jgi:hypothetical protein
MLRPAPRTVYDSRMQPGSDSFPRIDDVLNVRYELADNDYEADRLSDGGISFLLNESGPSVVPGQLVRIQIGFPTLDVDVECGGLCIQVHTDGDRVCGVFRFVNTHPATVESIRSIAYMHILRLGRALVGARI